MMMTRIAILTLFLSTFLFQAGCATSPEDQATAKKLVGTDLYTQVNMHSFKGKSVFWLNYQIDRLIPVNTRVSIDEISGAGVTFTIKETGQTLHLKNKQKHSGLSGAAWASKHFGPEPVNLSEFPKSVQEAIALAKAEPGMSKEAVIIALGYPPAHRMPSTDSASWLYWRNKWNRIAVDFGIDGNVKQVRD
jgi:hypothetical protein